MLPQADLGSCSRGPGRLRSALSPFQRSPSHCRAVRSTAVRHAAPTPTWIAARTDQTVPAACRSNLLPTGQRANTRETGPPALGPSMK
jgi:hypothetical protein